MISSAAAAFAGLVAGGAHVLAGADHVAAVAPLAADGEHRAWRVGFRWGSGHAVGVAIVGGAAVALREILPIEAVGSWSEWLVGVVLIGIGVWAATSAIRSLRDERRAGAPVHADGKAHGHGPHGRCPLHTHGERAALAVGVLHGTAGAAHVVGILPALAFPSRLAAISYLAAFGLGTVVAMTLFASLVGEASLRVAFSGPRARAGVMGGCAVASVVVGVSWLVP